MGYVEVMPLAIFICNLNLCKLSYVPAKEDMIELSNISCKRVKTYHTRIQRLSYRKCGLHYREYVTTIRLHSFKIKSIRLQS